MKLRFSGFDDGPVPDSTPVPSLSGDQHAKGSTNEKYYTVEEVAGILNVSPRTVRRMIRKKVIKSYKFGAARRIASSDLQALIARCCDI